MWTRVMLKNAAKDFLRRHYWKAFLVCLIVLIVGGSGSSNSNRSVETEPFNPPIFEQQLGDRGIAIPSNNFFVNSFFKMFGRSSPLFIIAGSTFAFVTLLFVILMITVGYALEVGQSRFFLRGFREDVSVGNLFSVFSREEYFGIVKTMFLRDVYLVLWTLLLIIPGIIKTFEYSMVPYILSQEPNLSTKEAIDLSRQMTNGHKWDMFVLNLSFIGWDILAGLLFGIGFIFLKPYKEATYAKLYEALSGYENFETDVIFE